MLANKVWRNITIHQIRQTLVPPNFRRLWYTAAWSLPLNHTRAEMRYLVRDSIKHKYSYGSKYNK